MNASPTSLLQLFYNLQRRQFVIPVYQRHYSWKEKHCEKLWKDLLRAGENNDINAHFIGSVVYIEHSSGNITDESPFSVIDGQQRLTTGTLLIAALADYIDTLDSNNLPKNFSAEMLRNNYLFNHNMCLTGDRYFKLILSKTDKDTLLAILKKEPPLKTLETLETSSKRIIKNYLLFRKLISDYQGNLENIYQGLKKLKVVDVKLERLSDDPQMIFESMNFTSMPLKQADLIRNYILMNLPPDLQTDLYNTYWQRMEDGFGDNYDNHFDPFMRNYLIAKTGKIPNVNGVYEAFKGYPHNKDISDLLSDMLTYSGYYCAMALDSESNADLKNAFNDLKELKVDVAYPFLLDAYHHYKQNNLKADDLLQIVRWLESYVFRRAICSIPTHSLNKIFATFSTSLKNKDRYLESVKAAFLLLPDSASSYRHFPSNEEFQRDIKVRDLYNFDRKKYWLRRLENHNRKELVMTDRYTIEHILPQTLSEEWKTELGSDWQDIQEKWLHRLGNLTLTAYNPEYSNNPFKYKQQLATKDGYKISLNVSTLQLNTWEFDLEVLDEKTGATENKKFSLINVPTWNEATILARAERLALEATKVWSIPQLAPDILETYRSSAIQQNDDEEDIINS
jgi:uncharacterized protein with ParB-like and HNH nuclease domain